MIKFVIAEVKLGILMIVSSCWLFCYVTKV